MSQGGVSLNRIARSRVSGLAFPWPFVTGERHPQSPHHRRIQSRRNREQAEDLCHLPLDRLDSDTKLVGDFDIGCAVGDPSKDSDLPRGELGGKLLER